MAFRVQLNFPRFPQLLAGLNNDFRVGHDVGNPQKCKLMQANTNMGSSLDTANLFIIKIEKCVLLKLDYKKHWSAVSLKLHFFQISTWCATLNCTYVGIFQYLPWFSIMICHFWLIETHCATENLISMEIPHSNLHRTV